MYYLTRPTELGVASVLGVREVGSTSLETAGVSQDGHIT